GRKGKANPAGKKPGTLGGRNKLLSDRLRVHLLRPFAGADDKTEMTNADKIAENLVHLAAHDSNLQAITTIFDRVEGKPAQTGHTPPGRGANEKKLTNDELSPLIGKTREGGVRKELAKVPRRKKRPPP